MNRVLAKKLGRDIWERKGSLLTLLLIIAIGVGAYVGMASVWRDLDGARADYYRDYRLTDFIVQLKRLPEQAARRIAQLPNVREVQGRIRQAILLDLPGLSQPLPGTAISMPEQRRPILNDLLLRTGAWFSGRNDNEVMLNHQFAQAHGIKPGTRIKALLMDKQHELLVVGTATSPEFVYLIPADGGFAPDPARFGVLYASEDFLRRASDLQGAWNQLLGKVYDSSSTPLDNTLKLIAERLDAYGVTLTTPARDDVSVRYLHDELAGLEVQARVMPTIFLGVAALVLNVLLGRLVAQQRGIIGTLRALGYTASAITRHYLVYGLVIGACGGLAGILLGAWIQQAMIDLYRELFAIPGLHSRIYPQVLAIGFAISLLFAMFGTWRGVRAASHLQPADAMRPPPPERGGRVLPERIGWIWRRLGFRSRMALRTLFRNPFRSSVSLLSAALATALVFSALSMVDALDYLMHYEFEQVVHQDFSVALRDAKPVDAVDELRRLPDVSYAEAQLSVICDLRSGPLEKRIGVIGLPPNGRLNTPMDAAGYAVSIPEHGLILARKLAEILGVKPGDRLLLRPLIGRRTEVSALVAGIVDTYLGLAAYADIRYLSSLLGEQQVVNSLLALQQTGQQAAQAELQTQLRRRPAVVGVSERTRALRQLDETFGETMGAMIGIIVLFAGAIAFGSVLNAALVSLSERRREVGTLRVLGYSPTQVAGIFAGESLLLNGLGIAAGLYGGIALAHLIANAYSTELYRFPVVILPASLAWSALLMLLFVGLAQWLVYRMVKRLDWQAVLNVKE